MVNIEDLVKLNQSTGCTKRKGYDDVPVEDDDDSKKGKKTVEAKSKMEMEKKETEKKPEEKKTGGIKKDGLTGSTEEHDIVPTANSVPSSGSKEPIGTEAKTPSEKTEVSKEVAEKKRQKTKGCCRIL